MGRNARLYARVSRDANVWRFGGCDLARVDACECCYLTNIEETARTRLRRTNARSVERSDAKRAHRIGRTGRSFRVR